jgi:hypothetical protein
MRGGRDNNNIYIYINLHNLISCLIAVLLYKSLIISKSAKIFLEIASQLDIKIERKN